MLLHLPASLISRLNTGTAGCGTFIITIAAPMPGIPGLVFVLPSFLFAFNATRPGRLYQRKAFINIRFPGVNTECETTYDQTLMLSTLLLLHICLYPRIHWYISARRLIVSRQYTSHPAIKVRRVCNLYEIHGSNALPLGVPIPTQKAGASILPGRNI